MKCSPELGDTDALITAVEREEIEITNDSDLQDWLETRRQPVVGSPQQQTSGLQPVLAPSQLSNSVQQQNLSGQTPPSQILPLFAPQPESTAHQTPQANPVVQLFAKDPKC